MDLEKRQKYSVLVFGGSNEDQDYLVKPIRDAIEKMGGSILKLSIPSVPHFCEALFHVNDTKDEGNLILAIAIMPREATKLSSAMEYLLAILNSDPTLPMLMLSYEGSMHRAGLDTLERIGVKFLDRTSISSGSGRVKIKEAIEELLTKAPETRTRASGLDTDESLPGHSFWHPGQKFSMFLPFSVERAMQRAQRNKRGNPLWRV